MTVMELEIKSNIGVLMLESKHSNAIIPIVIPS